MDFMSSIKNEMSYLVLNSMLANLTYSGKAFKKPQQIVSTTIDNCCSRTYFLKIFLFKKGDLAPKSNVALYRPATLIASSCMDSTHIPFYFIEIQGLYSILNQTWRQ